MIYLLLADQINYSISLHVQKKSLSHEFLCLDSLVSNFH